MQILNFFLLLENISTSPVTPPTAASTPVATPPSHLYYSHSWIPHNIEISLNSSCELFVEKMSVPKNDSTNEINNSNKYSTEEIILVGEDGSCRRADEMRRDSSEIIITGEREENVADDHIPDARPMNDERMEEEDKTENEKLDKVRYSLSAVVCYIDDKANEDRRNIVALLRVGPNYHERSVGSAVSQWYIFNDFWYVTSRSHSFSSVYRRIYTRKLYSMKNRGYG